MIDDQFVDAADKVADNKHREGVWELWAKYVIRQRNDGGRYIVAVDRDDSELPPRVNLEEVLEKTDGIVRAGSHEEQLVRQAVKRTKRRKQGDSYYPLVNDPDLFLKFARLADGDGLDTAATVNGLDTDKNADAALDWIRTFGVLGLTPVEVDGFRGASTRGGKADTVSSFAYEAWRANACLRLYEAATAEELDVNLIATYMPLHRQRVVYTHTPARTREWALNIVATETQKKVAGNAYPALYGEVGRFVAGWSFTNLLGAMWLQMFWLLTATETPRRCRNWECDKVIAYKQPGQPTQGVRNNDRREGYSTRKDRKFCDNKCRNRYNYLTRTKPRRHAAREL